MADSEARSELPYEKSERQLTRELELLISAALVFALLQLPGVLDRWWDGIGAHVTGTPFGVAFAAYYAGKLASYGLIVAILTHFLLRGFWVALMGLRSAYPGGIDPSGCIRVRCCAGFWRLASSTSGSWKRGSTGPPR